MTAKVPKSQAFCAALCLKLMAAHEIEIWPTQSILF